MPVRVERAQRIEHLQLSLGFQHVEESPVSNNRIMSVYVGGGEYEFCGTIFTQSKRRNGVENIPRRCMIHFGRCVAVGSSGSIGGGGSGGGGGVVVVVVVVIIIIVVVVVVVVVVVGGGGVVAHGI